MNIKRIIPLTTVLAALQPGLVHAAPLQMTSNPMINDLVSTVVYSIIGLLMALLAYRVIDAMTPGKLSEDIRQNNTALAIVVGSCMLGVCIIIAASIAG